MPSIQRMTRHLRESQQGQVVVEYTLLLAAVVAIMASVFGIIKERFVANENCTAGTVNPVCFMKKMIDPSGDMTFRYYSIQK